MVLNGVLELYEVAPIGSFLLPNEHPKAAWSGYRRIIEKPLVRFPSV